MNTRSILSRLSRVVTGVLITSISIVALLILSAMLSQALQSAGVVVGSPTPSQAIATETRSGYPAPTGIGSYPTDFPIDKRLLEQQIEQTRIAALIGTLPPAGAKEGPPTPIASEAPPWPLGIVEDGESPFLRSFTFTNRWQGVVDNQRMIAYAGYTKSDPLQGVVLIWESAFDLSNSFDTVHFSPVKDGALRIVAEDDLRLTLKTQNDQFLYFDIPSRQYIDSLTATPPPTITKLPGPPPTDIPTAYPAIATPTAVPTIPASP